MYVEILVEFRLLLCAFLKRNQLRYIKYGFLAKAFARNMHVKIKESEITIELSMSCLALSVPRTGVEPARLAALAPETSASTIPPPGHSFANLS